MNANMHSALITYFEGKITNIELKFNLKLKMNLKFDCLRNSFLFSCKLFPFLDPIKLNFLAENVKASFTTLPTLLHNNSY